MKSLLRLLPLLLAFSAQLAWATPSTIVRMPSSDVQPYATFHLGIDNNTTMFVPVDNGGYAQPTTYGITVGLLSLPLIQVEAGMDIREPTNKPITWNAKISMPEGAEAPGMPAITLGVYDMGTASGVNDYNILYGHVAKTISFLGRFTFGYFVGNASQLVKGSGQKDSNALMMSFDRRMPEINDRLWFGIDYMGTRTDYGSVNFAFSWSFSEQASLLVGYIRYNEEFVGFVGTDFVRRENLVTLQADFDF